MKRIIYSVLSISITFATCAQDGWNWPEDEALQAEAKEKQAYYKLLIATSEHAKALKELNWLYENNPNLHQTIYIEGVDCIEEIMKNEEIDKTREQLLKDSILWMFDQRIEHFDNDASTMDRKAYQAFQLYYKTPTKYQMLSELYAKAYEMNGPEISDFNLNS